jgi:hypothetical protein
MHSDGFPYGVGSMERTMGVCPENPSIYTQIDAHANHPCHGPANQEPTSGFVSRSIVRIYMDAFKRCRMYTQVSLGNQVLLTNV